VVMFAFAIYWSAANYTRPPGTPSFGLFRYRDKKGGAAPDAGKTGPGAKRAGR